MLDRIKVVGLIVMSQFVWSLSQLAVVPHVKSPSVCRVRVWDRLSVHIRPLSSPRWDRGVRWKVCYQSASLSTSYPSLRGLRLGQTREWGVTGQHELEVKLLYTGTWLVACDPRYILSEVATTCQRSPASLQHSPCKREQITKQASNKPRDNVLQKLEWRVLNSGKREEPQEDRTVAGD